MIVDPSFQIWWEVQKIRVRKLLDGFLPGPRVEPEKPIYWEPNRGKPVGAIIMRSYGPSTKPAPGTFIEVLSGPERVREAVRTARGGAAPVPTYGYA